MSDEIPVIDMGEISPEDLDAAVKALERAIKDKRCEAFRDGFNSGELSDSLKRGLMGLIAFYADHGENGGQVARLMRKSGILDGIPVETDHSINWNDVSHWPFEGRAPARLTKRQCFPAPRGFRGKEKTNG